MAMNLINVKRFKFRLVSRLKKYSYFQMMFWGSRNTRQTFLTAVVFFFSKNCKTLNAKWANDSINFNKRDFSIYGFNQIVHLPIQYVVENGSKFFSFLQRFNQELLIK